MKETIICDMDEVICDLLTPLFKEYNKIYKTSANINMLTDYFLLDGMKDIYKQEGFFLSLKPFPDAIETLEKLNEKYNLIIATFAETMQIVNEKYMWAKQNMPFIPFNNIVLGNYKWMMDADYLIDDNPHYLTRFKKCCICVDKPYNRDEGLNFKYRVNSLKDVEKILLTNQN
jgi:5'(3')-deoxyribonucleotidase